MENLGKLPYFHKEGEWTESRKDQPVSIKVLVIPKENKELAALKFGAQLPALLLTHRWIDEHRRLNCRAFHVG